MATTASRERGRVMAKPQLPAKAWLLEGYHEYESNPEIAHIKDVDVVFDAGDNWGCEYHEGKDFKWILGIPKRFIEFKPPVCPKCEGSGYQTIGIIADMRVAKKCDCQ